MREGAFKTSPSARRSTFASGILTGVSSLILSGSAAVTAAVLAREFGRDAATDGFLAAYAVYLVLALVAQAFRITVVPDLTRAAAEGRLGPEAGSYGAALLTVGIPLVAAAALLADPIGKALTGGLPPRAAELAANALPWLIAAALLQLLAALAAGARAALDSYLAPAIGFSAAGLVTVAVFFLLLDEHGLVSLAWGLAAGGAVALALPLTAFGSELRTLRPGPILRPLGRVAEAAALPVALQLLYLIAIRLAADLGVGEVTSLSYAYLFAAILVAATATALSAVSSAGLTRRQVDAEEAAAHVVHGAWLCLVAIAPAAGVFALAGEQIVSGVLGDEFAGDVGTDLSRLIIALAPWTVAATAFSLSFPLLYVLERSRVLVPVAVAALLVHLPLSLALRELWGATGLAIALALTTFAVIAALLAALSWRALAHAAVGVGGVALVAGAMAAVAFGAPALFLDGMPAAAVGVCAYALLVAVVRPRGLREAWAYVRTLH